MTNDEILQAAKEAGMTKVQGEAALFWYPEVERFAAIIEKRTIERCAVVCENIASLASSYPPMLCAAAIRKLGEQK